MFMSLQGLGSHYGRHRARTRLHGARADAAYKPRCYKQQSKTRQALTAGLWCMERPAGGAALAAPVRHTSSRRVAVGQSARGGQRSC